MIPPGLIVAAPASGSGKTLFTLGLLRHLSRQGFAVASFKAGPDYIDPAFHAAATGRSCLNLDPWAMRGETLRGAAATARDADLAVCEGVMGLFDGATESEGSTADLAALLGWPVVLVIDARAMAGSAAAVLRGFATHRADVPVAGAVFNKVGSPAHEATLRRACAAALPGIPVLGCLPRVESLRLPERHLGLVQAVEHPDLERFLEAAADLVAACVDTSALRGLARPGGGGTDAAPVPLPPPGQRIAVADDAAFAFAYPLTLAGWRAQGAEIVPFSPLADQAPDGSADAVYLPGGYPELHAGRLAGNSAFLAGLRAAAARGAWLFGECGGYMVLGEGLVDVEGVRHAMAGLLPLETSFAARRLHLGYRAARSLTATPFGPPGTRLAGHEFHYATVLREGPGQALFDQANARGEPLPPAGLAAGRTAGSFVHLVDRMPGP